MNSDTLLEFAQFQLSSCRTRCVLFVSGDGKTEKIASGFLKPFLTHLKVAEEQANQSVQLIQLEVEKGKNAANWFNKGTLERFVRFVSTPEILEAVNTFDAEMSQLEGARKIYSQGSGSQHSSEKGENESSAIAAADSTKKELLRAIDVRLAAVKQDLATACSRASSAGFSLNAVSDLLLFANKFGAHRLREACTKFIALCHNRPDLITHQRVPSQTSHQLKGTEDSKLRSSSDSDMSIDEPEVNPTSSLIKPLLSEPSQNPTTATNNATETTNTTGNMLAQQVASGSRRLSVQDRINLFESKKKEQSTSASSSSSVGGGISKVAVVKGEHKRQPSDASVEKSVLKRWSGASDMSIDATSSSNSFASAVVTPTSTMNSPAQPSGSKAEVFKDAVTSLPKLDSRDSSMLSSSSSSLSHDHTKASISEDKTHHGGFNNNTVVLASFDSTLESEDNTKVTNKKVHSTVLDKIVSNISEDTSTQANIQGPSIMNFKTIRGKTADDTSISKLPLESPLQSKSSLGKFEISSKQVNSETRLNAAHTRNKEAVKNEEATVIQSSLKFPTDGGNNPQRKQVNQGTNIPVFPMEKNKELNPQPIFTLTAQKTQAKNDDLQMKADELEKLFAAHKLRVHGDQATSPRRNKTKPSGLEAQKSTLKMQPEVVQSADFSAGEEFEPDLLRKMAKNLDSTDNMKPKVGEFSPSDEYRGRLYSKYMQKRDEKLREEQGSKSAEKEAKLKAMQENLERSQAEMKAKFAKSATRSRAEKMRSFNVRSSLKTKGQTIDLFHGEGEGTLARSYSDTLSGNESTTSSKRLSSNKSLLSSSTARTSSIPKPNVKAPNSNSIRRRDQTSENPIAQSVPNFSDLRKENTKPAVRDEKSRRPSMRKSLGSPNDIVSDSKPFLRKSNGRNPNAFLKTNSKTSTNLKSPKEEEFSESSLHVVKEKEEDFDRTSASEVPVESESENDYVTVAESQDMDDSITEYSSKPNHSFSYVNEASDIDASVDSPTGSPASWNSHPLNQMMEADTARMRKKWGSAQVPVIVANAPQNARKDVTKGFKRFLKFGRKGRGSDYLVNDWVSASTASEGDDDTEDGRELGSRTSDELRKSRMGYTNSSSYNFNSGDAFPEHVQSLQSCITDAPTNFKFRDDPLSGNSMKASRSFFSLSSFRSKVNEAKPR